MCKSNKQTIYYTICFLCKEKEKMPEIDRINKGRKIEKEKKIRKRNIISHQT